ncbi:MAG: WecB/TagA/CpsF family glycosyltransferase [Syntrophomonadaceae bacterium]|nr:WecB/TagA/CpsF family glycosyltransferase [Syntrophomonadaceae bacterium]
MIIKDIATASILGCKVHLLNMAEAVQIVEQLVKDGQDGNQVVTLNAEIIYQTKKEIELQRIINSASLVTADGIGTVWAARVLGYPQKERVSGIDLLHEVCAAGATRGWKLYLLGAAPGVAAKAGQKLELSYPGLKVCGSRHGYFSQQDEPKIIAEINSKSPDILLAALGAPKQEYWIDQKRDALKAPVCIGVGGSFDVIAGIKKRAPKLFIMLNLEWLYRLLTEPARWKRQLALPAFVLAVLKQKYGRTN